MTKAEQSRMRATRRRQAGFLLVGIANVQEVHNVALEGILHSEGQAVFTKKERKALSYALVWHRKATRYIRAVGKHLEGENHKEEARKAVEWSG